MPPLGLDAMGTTTGIMGFPSMPLPTGTGVAAKLSDATLSVPGAHRS